MTSFADLIGKPFAEKGRGPDVYDCVGILRECWRRWHGVELPEYPFFSGVPTNSAMIDYHAQTHWRKLPAVEPGSALVMRVAGFGAHVGFAISETKMIHSARHLGVVVERIGALRPIMGAYAYVG